VNCHASPATRQLPKMDLYFRQWQGSAHDQAGVDCFGCHGGNSQAPDPAAAHAGMKHLRDPQEVIQTCGGCHPGQFTNFQKSRHYVRLMNHQQAPTCVTCHGSRTASALSPDQVPRTCAQCHNPETGNHPDIPDQAGQIFGLYQTVQNAITQARASIKQAEAEGRPVEESAQKLKLAEAMLVQIKETWHSFSLDETQNLMFRTNIVANQAIYLPGTWQRIPLWIKLVGLFGAAAIVVIAGLALKKRPVVEK